MANTSAPVDNILSIRRDFPKATIRFEIELSAPANLSSLRQSCEILEKAGAVLETMRLTRQGKILLSLCDSASFDPETVSTALAQSPALHLDRWTIVLGSARVSV